MLRRQALSGCRGTHTLQSPRRPCCNPLCCFVERHLRMRIVLASSEAVPFSKTGGLADVASALPKSLALLGHEVTLITPYYPRTLVGQGSQTPQISNTGREVSVRIAGRTVTARILQSQLPSSSVTVYLIDQPGYFDRPGLYVDGDRDYPDNCERFTFFSRAVLEAARVLNLQADIFHANDWQTGLVPALLKAEYSRVPGFSHAAAVFTIHNMAFQGQFWHWDMLLTGLDWKYFNWRQMEFFGNLNLLKTGIVFSDMVTTVSPTYAREIQTAEFGCGMHGVLSSRRDDLVGILNGCDTEVWNPTTDPLIPCNYDLHSVFEGKAVCKQHLQRQFGLPERPGSPLIGSVSRITSQKGFDLIAACGARLAELDLQMVFLGTGDKTYEQRLQKLAADFPDKIAVRIGYDEALSHLIEAGSDLFLMPSQFEPCGLNQMYSLIYGTPPIVRAVGGLADSVVDATEANMSHGIANGFTFYESDSDVLFRQICRAVGLMLDRRSWSQLVRTGMERDWSWRRSAAEYVRTYDRALQKRAAVAAE